MTESAPTRVMSARFARFVEPAPGNLPNVRVALGFPAVLLIVLIALVGLGITGSSTGYIRTFLESGHDPALIAGTPESVRSDEWYVQSSWTISQVKQGLPISNESFPGGMDSTVQHELPSKDWSVAFRPHLLGFLFLPLDNAMAVKWWLPGLLLIAAGYFFLVSMMPRRPLTSAALSTGFFFAPFFQWWYLPITFWPAIWCFIVMAAAIWLFRSKRRAPAIVVALIAGYVTVTTGMGIYVPFIIPAVLVALAFVIGLIATRSSSRLPTGVGSRIRALLPLGLAGLGGVLVLGIWLLTRLPTIERFLGTVYPGQRLQGPGGATIQSNLALIAAPVTNGLGEVSGPPLIQNPSELSTFFLTGLFLLIPLAALLVQSRMTKKTTDWLIVSLLALGALMVAYLVVPGWDAVAHLLLLDRTSTGRIRLGFGLLSMVSIAVFVNRRDASVSEGNRWAPRSAEWAAGAFSLVSVIGLVGVLAFKDSPLVVESWKWIPVSFLFVASVFLIAKGRAFWGAAAFLAISVFGSAGVNPVYHGVYDTGQTAIGRELTSLDRSDSGAWVGVGSTFLPTVLLVQSGMKSFNGFQSAPAPTMWRWIDPTHRYENVWNRLANVAWSAGSGEPVPFNPATDQIRVSFDSCAEFAQRHVKYALSDAKLDQSCLKQAAHIRQGPSTFWIYRVVSAP